MTDLEKKMMKLVETNRPLFENICHARYEAYSLDPETAKRGKENFSKYLQEANLTAEEWIEWLEG